MINKIKLFFETQLQLTASVKDEDIEHRLKLTSATLLLEMMLADGDTSEIEEQQVRQLLQQQFELDETEIEELLELAHTEKKQATDYYQFTQLINQHYTQAQKIQLVEQLWLVAYADQTIDRHEEHLVRRLADLLHVPHSAFIQSKHRAADSAE